MNHSELKIELRNANTRIFLSTMKSFGFVAAYRDVLNNKSSSEKEAILSEVFSSFLSMSTKDLSQYNLQSNLPNIINSDLIDEDYKIYITFQHFSCILKNYVIDINLKRNKIDEMLESLCEFSRYKDGQSEIHKKSLLYFFKDFVLLNQDIEMQKHFYEKIIYSLAINNQTYSKHNFIATISEMFLALYIYSFYEDQSIKESHVESLRALLSYNINTPSNVRISLSRLIEENITEVIKYYIENLFSEHYHFWLFDFFPDGGGVQVREVPENRNVRIIIALSYLFEFSSNVVTEFSKHFQSGPIPDNHFLERICLSALQCFDNRTSDLSPKTKQDVERLKPLFINKGTHTQKSLYLFFNNMRKKSLITTYQNDNPQIEIEKINKSIKATLSQKAGSAFNPSLLFNESSKMYLTPNIKHRQFSTNSFLIDVFTNNLYNYIWQAIHKVLPVQSIDFSESGLALLENLLVKNSIKITSFILDYEYGFSQQVKDSKEYLSLKTALNDIKVAPINGTYNVFLNVDSFEFNFAVINYESRDLSFEEAEEWIQSRKIAEDVYEIDFTTMSYDEIKVYTQEYLIVETVFFNLVLNIDESSGFIIEYEFD